MTAPEFLSNVAHLHQRGGADVGAGRVSEQQERPAPREARVVERAATMVLESEREQCLRLRQLESRDRGWRDRMRPDSARQRERAAGCERQKAAPAGDGKC